MNDKEENNYPLFPIARMARSRDHTVLVQCKNVKNTMIWNFFEVH
jgi:hypothetical protein